MRSAPCLSATERAGGGALTQHFAISMSPRKIRGFPGDSPKKRPWIRAGGGWRRRGDGFDRPGSVGGMRAECRDQETGLLCRKTQLSGAQSTKRD